MGWSQLALGIAMAVFCGGRVTVSVAWVLVYWSVAGGVLNVAEAVEMGGGVK